MFVSLLLAPRHQECSLSLSLSLSQAFIHPSLARFFWSAADTARSPAMTWSPYEFCNGTFTSTRAHIFSFFPDGFDFGRFVFIDFAGSGLVHVCGEWREKNKHYSFILILTELFIL